jgi:SulP family sulfate permease
VAACITFIYRISSLSRSEAVEAKDYPALQPLAGQVAAYRLYGALFFGAVKLVEEIQDHLPSHTLVIDLKNVIYVDSSGADTLNDLARACRKNGVRLIMCGLNNQPLDIAKRSGLTDTLGPDHLFADLKFGMAAATSGPPDGGAR